MNSDKPDGGGGGSLFDSGSISLPGIHTYVCSQTFSLDGTLVGACRFNEALILNYRSYFVKMKSIEGHLRINEHSSCTMWRMN